MKLDECGECGGDGANHCMMMMALMYVIPI